MTNKTQIAEKAQHSEQSMQAALQSVDSIPCNEDGPVFNAPWEAEAFAMTLALYEKGVFTWPQWAQVLAKEIEKAQRNGDPDLGNTYYHHWLCALEKIVVQQGITSEAQLSGLYDDWNKAALSTPHGEPIVLDRK